MAVQGETVSHNYILVIRKFVDFMSLFIHSMFFFRFLLNSFPLQNLDCATYSCV